MRQQLTLGQLINLLKDEPETNEVQFDFCWARPSGVCSWRGAYELLAITVKFGGYGFDYKTESITVKEFLKMLKDAVGESFLGWKGGEFQMSLDTPLYVTTHAGNNCETVPIGIKRLQYGVTVILTTLEEY